MVEVLLAAAKQEGIFEVLGVSKATCQSLDRHDLAVNSLRYVVGDSVRAISDDVVDLLLEYRLELAGIPMSPLAFLALIVGSWSDNSFGMSGQSNFVPGGSSTRMLISCDSTQSLTSETVQGAARPSRC